MIRTWRFFDKQFTAVVAKISDEKISWEHCSNNKYSDVWIISICNCLVEYELKRNEKEKEREREKEVRRAE